MMKTVKKPKRVITMNVRKVIITSVEIVKGTHGRGFWDVKVLFPEQCGDCKCVLPL